MIQAVNIRLEDWPDVGATAVMAIDSLLPIAGRSKSFRCCFVISSSRAVSDD